MAEASPGNALTPEDIFTQHQRSPLKYAGDQGKGDVLEARPLGEEAGRKGRELLLSCLLGPQKDEVL